MDAQDLNRRIIGLLTVGYNALPDLEQGEVDEDFERQLKTAVNTVVDGWSARYSVDVALPPLQLATMQTGLKQLEGEISGDLMAMFGMFTGLFVRLCQEVEDQYPDIDIPAILQTLALEAAARE